MRLFSLLSIVLVAAGITLAALGYIWWAILCGLVASFFILRSYIALKISHKNIITVLKAVENNDHTFYLKESSYIEYNKGFNQTLNQIKSLIQATQKEVRAQELFLSQIIEQVPTGILITTSKGSVRFINNAALSYLSLPVVTHLHRIRQVYPELFEALMEMRDNESRSVTIQNEKEIQQLVVEKNSTHLASEMVTVITFNDINSELERRETDSWISLIRVMTHEIMNSIAPIRSISEVLLLQENQDDINHQAIKTIHDTSDNLIRFVDDYRKFSSVPQPELIELDVKEVLDQAIMLIKDDVQKKGIEVKMDLTNGHNTFFADKNQIMQVLQNLLKNALEATPNCGSIEISTGITHTQKNIIKIYNSGQPIPDNIREYIFIPFFTTKEGGSGIGLSLSRYIMRLHGGNLRYLAQPNGSTFILEF